MMDDWTYKKIVLLSRKEGFLISLELLLLCPPEGMDALQVCKSSSPMLSFNEILVKADQWNAKFEMKEKERIRRKIIIIGWTDMCKAIE